MTDLSYPQPPVMTAAHVDAMHTVCSLWPYVTVVDPALLAGILRHLEALLPAPVASRNGIRDESSRDDNTHPLVWRNLVATACIWNEWHEEGVFLDPPHPGSHPRLLRLASGAFVVTDNDTETVPHVSPQAAAAAWNHGDTFACHPGPPVPST